MAKKTLDELKEKNEKFSDLEIELVDVVTNPSRSLKDGVRMIPYLKSGTLHLSGIILTRKKIEKFLQQIMADK